MKDKNPGIEESDREIELIRKELNQNESWESLRSFDDIIRKGERSIIDDVILEVEKGIRARCPYLTKDGEYFYYCGAKVQGEQREDNRLEPFNPKYQNHIEVTVLQIFCTDNYKKCINYPDNK